jgi:hypothetical protein
MTSQGNSRNRPGKERVAGGGGGGSVLPTPPPPRPPFGLRTIRQFVATMALASICTRVPTALDICIGFRSRG